MSPIRSFISNFKEYIKDRPNHSPPQKSQDSESSNISKMLDTLHKKQSISGNTISIKEQVSSSVTLSSQEITQSKILDLVSLAKHAKLQPKSEDQELKQIAKYIFKHLPHNEKIEYKWIKLTLRYMFRHAAISTKEKEHFFELIHSHQYPNRNTISIINKILKTAKTHKKIEQHALKKIARYLFKYLPKQEKDIDYNELKVILNQLNCNDKLSIEEKIHIIHLVSNNSEKPSPNDRIVQRLFAKVTKVATINRNIEDEKLKQIAKLLLKHIKKEENIDFKQIKATLVEMDACKKLTIQEKQHLLNIIKKKKKIDNLAMTIFSKIVEEPRLILKRVTEMASRIKEAPEVLGEKGRKLNFLKN